MKVRDNATHWLMVDAWELRLARRDARREFPADWLPIIDAEAREARPAWNGRKGYPLEQARVWRSWLDQYGGAAAANMTDSQIRAQAAAYALEARSLDIGEFSDEPARELARIAAFCRARGVEPPPEHLLLRGIASRVRCPYWWRRALRRMVAQRCEAGAMALGLVSKPARQPYASNSAVWRRLDQTRRNARAAEAIMFANDEGRVSSLAELCATSTSNKAIRRGELMTRIRGCEEIADECGHVGLFLTLTCPSRFHSTLRDGRRNPRHDGSRPSDGQRWLCGMWAKARAALARRGVRTYGFRVAEPHHDGCPHWHALLWFADDAAAARAQEVIRHYWLSDAGDEQGADQYRVNFKRMDRGGAAGYVAKYVSKNIDDHGIESHLDDYAEGEIGPDLLGDLEIKPSMRVEAWAATWRIRQFQAIGQPPVGVWRELRRIKEAEARKAGFGGTIYRAWTAAQRVGTVLADWARYVRAQGGMMLGRRCRIVMRSHEAEAEGLYGRAVRRFPVGVALNVSCASTVWSNRRLWRPIESSDEACARHARAVRVARSAAPRTGVNNCTQATDATAAWLDFHRGQGAPGGPRRTDSGIHHQEKPPCSSIPASP